MAVLGLTQTQAAKPPGKAFVLLCGVIFPAEAIGFEDRSGLFGLVFFEAVRPLPLALLVPLVPLANILYLWAVNREQEAGSMSVRLAGMAEAICCAYALPFVFVLSRLIPACGSGMARTGDRRAIADFVPVVVFVILPPSPFRWFL